MMAQDARYRTKAWLDTYLVPANVTKDDDVSHATFQVMFAFPDYPLTREFKSPSVVCVIYAVGEPTSTPTRNYNQSAYGYDEQVPIFICSMDKTGVTGTLVKWKAEAELRRITETYYEGSLRGLDRRADRDQRFGSETLYMTEYTLRYWRDTT